MTRVLAAVILLISSLQAMAQEPCPAPTNSGAVASAHWSYEVSLADQRRQLLHVSLTIAPTSPKLEVQLPVWNAVYQVRDFAEHVNWLRATDAEGKTVAVRELDKTTWAVPNATTVEYEIAAIDPGPFGAELTQRHAFLNLAQVLIYPVGAPKGVIHLRVSGVPKNWRVASPMNSEGDGFCASNYDRMVDSPVEASDFHELDFSEGGAKYRVIVDANRDDYDDEEIEDILRKIVAAETGWMQDRPFERYTFFYHFPPDFGRGGMEHAYGTAIETSAARLKDDPLVFAGVSAHEFFHLWNVKRIRPQSLEPIDYTKENYTRALWFSEGVTTTVSESMLVRAGLMNERMYLDRLAGVITGLEARPANRTQSAEESSLDTWLEKYPYYRAPERSISYYDKGQVLGVLLDLEMRRVTEGRKSLRDLFQWMDANYAKKGKYFHDSEGVRRAAEAVTGVDFGEFFAKYVSGTEPIPYDRFFAAVGLQLKEEQFTSADPGFTSVSNFGSSPVVIAVAPGGEAERAGLRPGDIILSVNGAGAGGNVSEQLSQLEPGLSVKLKVQSRTGEREVKYKLTARRNLAFTFSELANATDAQRSSRAAWVRGDDEAAH